MFFKINIVINALTLQDLDDLKDKALDALEEGLTINPGEPNQERSSILIERCYHDEDPSKPCEQLYHAVNPFP